MGLINEEIEVGIGSKTDQYYESKGYILPRRKLEKKKYPTIIRGSMMKIWTKDLHPKSAKHVNIDCDLCGNRFSTRYNRYLKNIERYEGKALCRKCAATVTRGEKIYGSIAESILHFNDNIELSSSASRYTKEYKQFIYIVMSRDDFTCQHCGSKSNLVVHHLDGYNWCIEKRIDINNGITLCEECHNSFHFQYGKGNNTKFQYEEWIGQEIHLRDFDGKLRSARAIFCHEDQKAYNSVSEYAKIVCTENASHIYAVCNHMPCYHHYHGKHIFWLDEYINLSPEEINHYVNPPNHIPTAAIEHNKIPVVCLNNLKVFESSADAARFFNIWPAQVSSCCRHDSKHTYTKDKEKLYFMHYDEYFKKYGANDLAS